MIEGLKIATVNSGLKYKNRDDLLLVTFDDEAEIAGVFTKSSTAASPVLWCKKNIKKFNAKALVVNAGNANAFTGKKGEETVKKTAKIISEILQCQKQQIFISSTGVIGEEIDDDKLGKGIIKASKKLNNGENLYIDAAKAIMTTDTRPKIIKKNCKIDDKEIEIIGIAKGSGMIAPNMATMLGYIFCDANIAKDALAELLKENVENTFNSITVDSDSSTNDSVLLFATKKAGNNLIKSPNSNKLKDFKEKLAEICLELAKMIVCDGEGAKKLIEIEVAGAKTQKQASDVAFGVANSPLVKTAIAGNDPNWGRIIMAVGKSTINIKQNDIIVKIGKYVLTQNGARHPGYVESDVHKYLKNKEVKIFIDLGNGNHQKTVWTCDLTEGYIKINKDYRS